MQILLPLPSSLVTQTHDQPLVHAHISWHYEAVKSTQTTTSNNKQSIQDRYESISSVRWIENYTWLWLRCQSLCHRSLCQKITTINNRQWLIPWHFSFHHYCLSSSWDVTKAYFNGLLNVIVFKKVLLYEFIPVYPCRSEITPNCWNTNTVTVPHLKTYDPLNGLFYPSIKICLCANVCHRVLERHEDDAN